MLFGKSKKNGPCTCCHSTGIVVGVLATIGALISLYAVYSTLMLGGAGSDESSLALIALALNLVLVSKSTKYCGCSCAVPVATKK